MLLDSSAPTELIFLGTGTSASLPYIDCLTSQNGPKCNTCTSTVNPSGKYNIRRNTSAVLKTHAKDGREITIVIDAGKTFQAASLEWFPKYGLRKIDAVLITHGHADAMYGLDDFRAWTLYGLIQPYMDVYLSQETFEAVQRSFPYLISEKYASGGGDVPEFRWHIIEDRVPFEINDTGVRILPFAVHHGQVRVSVASSPPLGQTLLPMPPLTRPSTPLPGLRVPSPDPSGRLPSRSSSLLLPDIVAPQSLHASPRTRQLIRPSTPAPRSALSQERDSNDDVFQPYLSFGFKVKDEIIYISDASHIPDDVWPVLSPQNNSPATPVCVLDCLQLKPHVSHLNLAQSVAFARRIGARKTYLTGFCHEITHDEYVNITSALETPDSQRSSATLSELEASALSTIVEGKPIWIRPAHDGLRVLIDTHGGARDDTYHSSAYEKCFDSSALNSLRYLGVRPMLGGFSLRHLMLIMIAISCSFLCGYLSGR